MRGVGCLADGQDERQRAALAIGGEVDLADLPAPRTPQESGLQSEFPAAPDASSLLPFGLSFGVPSDLSFQVAPFGLAFSSSAAAFSRAVSTSSFRCIPAASW